MIHLTYSNRTEALLAALVERLDARRARFHVDVDPLEPVHIVVPNRNVERYVELGLARGLGVAAHLHFQRLEGLVEAWLGERLLVGSALKARVLRAFLDEDVLQDPACARVRRYLGGGGSSEEARDRRRAQLALHCAHLLEEYGFSRPDLLDAWSRGESRFAAPEPRATEGWQRRIFDYARLHPASDGWKTLSEALQDAGPPPSASIHVFGLSYVARMFSQLFATLGERSDLFIYALNPCEEFWEDIETSRELRRRRRTSDAEPDWGVGDDPFGLSVDTETPLLRMWGRPGREHVRLLDALTECDFEARFVDPIDGTTVDDALPLFAAAVAPPLLARLQHDVLTRSPVRAAPPERVRDDSVTILACPSVRREVETVAQEIWRAVETVDGLTFDEVAVLVNGPDRELYLPHLTSVFGEARDIPFTVTDLTLTAASPIVDNALRLITLPAGELTRPEVLATLNHPSTRPPDVDPHAWTTLCDRLGIFRGLDVRSHVGTYLEGEEQLTWEQGLVRLSLGAFMEGEEGEGARFFELGDQAYLPEDPPLGETGHARFAALARSLVSDVDFARNARLSLSDWARFFEAMLRAYLRPADEHEESALRRALRALGSLTTFDLDGAPVSHPVALELARTTLEGLGAERGQPLAEGVSISSMMPMRAIPFRVVCVLGLSEGKFPASDRRDALDLRAAHRRAGDVTPSERDRYTFLETLLCTRDRLILSYVARDERTGDSLAPSTVVNELLEVIETSHLTGAREHIVRQPPLRRHEADGLGVLLPAVAAEQRAERLGVAMRAALSDEGRDDVLDGLDAADTARLTGDDGPLARSLGLAPFPTDRAAEEEGEPLRLSLAALRQFLECPLQGWTRSVLRLRSDDLGDTSALEDEPFAANALDLTGALRAAFELLARERTLHDDEAMRLAYQARADRLAARGRWPVGAIGELAAEDHITSLRRWRAGWARAFGDEAGETLRVRFGSANEVGYGDLIRPPLQLDFAVDPRGGPSDLTALLTGRTELMRRSAKDEEAWVSMSLKRRTGARGRVDELRLTLHAFVAHAALCATGEARPRSVIQLYANEDDAAPSRATLAAIEPEVARGWLKDIVASLVEGSHAYLLPVDAVLRLERGFASIGAAEIESSIAFVREKWSGGRSRWGPVRRPLEQPPLRGVALEDAVERRFGLFFRTIGGNR